MVIKVMLLFWHSHVKGGVDFSFPKSSVAVTCCDSAASQCDRAVSHLDRAMSHLD